MSFWLVIKLLIVVLFLVMFLRRPSLVWGVGLLTVTTAVLLDTVLGTFGREEMLAQLGFFFYVISGFLFAGAAFWLLGLLRPMTESAVFPVAASSPVRQHQLSPSRPLRRVEGTNTAFDRQMLYDEIRQRFGREDILDLIFDLGINENDVMALDQPMNQLIVSLMDLAEQRGQMGALALAVERILTPPPPENLPRLEKITADSPPTILRHYLLTHYNLEQLATMAQALGIDWEQIGGWSKKTKVRELLLYLYRRNRIDELVAEMRQALETAVADDADLPSSD
ncbi:MAG: hypothetical protein D6706_20630 [Chloroflexi bacterium]|nr:MAG: hypothetical protein D6706_20630 [Chloroflexota bacterium]